MKNPFFENLFYAYSLGVGIYLVHHPNSDIVAVCPNSNMWYVVFLHAMLLNAGDLSGAALIPFEAHALFDECNRTKLGHSVLYILLIFPYVFIGLGIVILLFIGVVSWISSYFQRRTQRRTQTPNEVTNLLV